MAEYNSLSEFSKALQTAYNGLGGVIEQSLNTRSNSLANAVKKRVSGTGKNATGGSFSPYAKSSKNKRPKYGNGSLGKQTGYKGFYYQGTMWDNFKLLLVKNMGNTITAKLGFTGSNLYKTNEELSDIHTATEGTNIAMPNNDEVLDFTNAITADIYNYLAKTL